jgi:hypothetical protein
VLHIDWRWRAARCLRLSAPEEAKSLPVLPDQRTWFHDDERGAPVDQPG